ncbi:MAG TPA: PKD domain-containing protein [Bacteroidia bacterium]|nr:PKD domain-containing protein [Bacteroidia bacterium]
MKKISIITAFTFTLLLLFNNNIKAQSCGAGFSYTPPDQNGLVVFQDTSWSQDQILSWTWDLGDGTIASTPIYTHIYASNGTYQVCLIIESATCTDTVCQYIAVTLANPCNLNATISLIGPPPQNTLSASVTGGVPPYTYSWNNGSTQQTTVATANMNYCVTITDAQGCTSVACYNYTAGCNILASIVVDTSANTLMAVATLGVSPYTYLWNTGSTQSTIYTTTAGNYCVTVTDVQGCSTTVCYNYNTQGCGYVFTYTQTSPGVYLFVSNTAPTMQTIWDFGDGTIDTIIGNQITHTFQSSMTYLVCMNSIGCNAFCTPVYAMGLPTSTLCGTVFNDANGNSVIDTNETGLGPIYMFIYGAGTQLTAYSDSITGNFSFLVPPGTYTIQMCPTSGGILQNGIITVPTNSVGGPTTSCASYTVTIGANDTICGLNYGVFMNASTVTGTLFYDVNSNGIMDSGETGIPYQTIQIGTYTAYTDANGNYNISVPMGSYTISYTPSGFYSSGTITTTSVVAQVTQNGMTYGNNNIGLYMTPGQVDLGITISPSTTVTPGFGAWYSINVCNYGTTPTAATVMMQYDAALTPNYQTPAGASVNTTNQLITWNLPAINPGSCSYIWVSFQALIGIQLGSSAVEFVSVNPVTGIDNNLNNNTDTVHQIVVGSWDPNNKLVVYTNIADPNYQIISSVEPNQEIRYTINFQNTGNAPAHNVVVVDEMSSNLDINSFEFIGASHNCTILRNGNTTTYKFMNIMLPDSTNNEPASHGFVTYKLNANNGLNIGEQIIDYANIYFDFNAPVLTEDAVITMVGPTALGSILQNEQANLFPNPAQEFVYVNLTSADDGNVNINVTDATGKTYLQQQRVLKTGYNKVIINTSELSKGIYFVQTTTQDGVVRTSKLSIK